MSSKKMVFILDVGNTAPPAGGPYVVPGVSGSSLKFQTATNMENLWRSLGAGALGCTSSVRFDVPTGHTGSDGLALGPIFASGSILYSQATGSLTIVVNPRNDDTKVTLTKAVSWSINDPQTALEMEMLVNSSSNPAVAGCFTAQAVSSSLFLRAYYPGNIGNLIALTGSGTGAIFSNLSGNLKTGTTGTLGDMGY